MRPAPVLLGLALFTFATAELFTAGALVPMHEDLGVPVASVGRLVTTYAVVAGLALLPAAALTRRVPARPLLVAGMLALAASQVALAAAPNLLGVELARALAAVFHGAVWAGVPVAAAALRPDRPGRATAAVFVGGSLGSVLGAPLVAQVSQTASWRLAALLLGAIAALCAAGLLRWLPDLPAQGPVVDAVPASRTSRRRIGLWCLTIVPLAAAYVASYTFVTQGVRDAGVPAQVVPALLLLMGVVGLVATMMAGRVHDRVPAAGTLASVALMTVGFALGLLPGAGWFLGGLVLWAAGYAALIVQVQSFVTADSPGWSRTASSVYVLTFQVGIAVGGWLGGRHLPGLDEVTSRAATSTALASIGTVLVTTTLVARRRGPVGSRPEDRGSARC